MAEFLTNYGKELLVTILTGLLGLAIKQFRNLTKAMIANNNGTKEMLRANIEEECEKAQQKKYCEPHELTRIITMHTSYKALGGNGTTDSLVDDVKHLPHNEPD